MAQFCGFESLDQLVDVTVSFLSISGWAVLHTWMVWMAGYNGGLVVRRTGCVLSIACLPGLAPGQPGSCGTCGLGSVLWLFGCLQVPAHSDSVHPQ